MEYKALTDEELWGEPLDKPKRQRDAQADHTNRAIIAKMETITQSTAAPQNALQRPQGAHPDAH